LCGSCFWFWLASMSNSMCDSVVKFCVCMLYWVGSIFRRVPHVVLYLSVPSVAVVVGVFIW